MRPPGSRIMHNVKSWYGRAMRFINLAGRMTLVAPDGLGVDVERASGGRLPASPAEALDRWAELEAWAAQYGGSGDVEIVEALLGPPSSAPPADPGRRAQLRLSCRRVGLRAARASADL